MARPHCPGSCGECQDLCKREPEHLRPACWFGRVCPYSLIEADDELARAYQFSRKAVTLEEHYDPQTKGRKAEWVFTRESVQWACWLYALKTAEDRLAALDIIAIVGLWSKRGQEWDVLRALAESHSEAGVPSEEHVEILQIDEDLE